MRLIFGFLILCVGQWSQIAPSGPSYVTTDPNAQMEPYDNAPMWFADGALYLYGNELWKYEFVDSRWIWMPPVPFPSRSNAASWVMRDVMYLYGGIGDDGTVLDDMWSYSPQTRTATRIPIVTRSAPPPPLYGMAYWTHPQSNRLYMWGGGTTPNGSSTLPASLYAFDVTSGVWSGINFSGSSIPPATAFAAAALSVDGSLTYLYANDHLYQLDMTTYSWSQSPTTGINHPPGPNRQGAVIWTSRNILYLYGGTAGSLVYGDTWKYEDSEWIPLVIESGPLPTRSGFATASNGSSALYLFGGGDENDIWAFGVASKSTILQEMQRIVESSALWAFLSAVFSGLVLIIMTFLTLYACVRWCVKRRREMRFGSNPINPGDNVQLI